MWHVFVKVFSLRFVIAMFVFCFVLFSLPRKSWNFVDAKKEGFRSVNRCLVLVRVQCMLGEVGHALEGRHWRVCSLACMRRWHPLLLDLDLVCLPLPVKERLSGEDKRSCSE